MSIGGVVGHEVMVLEQSIELNAILDSEFVEDVGNVGLHGSL